MELIVSEAVIEKTEMGIYLMKEHFMIVEGLKYKEIIWFIKLLFVISVAGILSIVLVGCSAESTFDGNKISNTDVFEMDYSVLNQQEAAELTMETGDSLQVSVIQESGTVDVTVGIAGNEPVYEGNHLTDMDFMLNISESGIYQISVTGHNARGSVAFKIIEAETIKQSTQEQSDMYDVYQFALQQIAFEHIYPDGTDTGFDSAGGFIEDNHFAVFDINYDGVDELIVQFVTAPMAGNIEKIYTYNEAENALETMLEVFPAVTYYDNGIVKEEWSHGSDLAGEDYWPYNLYQYHVQNGQYTLLAEVNMWSKYRDTVDYKGDSYPESIDTENTGTVFILTRNGITETVSKSEYEAWLADVIGNAQPIQVPYLSLNEGNIQNVINNAVR